MVCLCEGYDLAILGRDYICLENGWHDVTNSWELGDNEKDTRKGASKRYYNQGEKRGQMINNS